MTKIELARSLLFVNKKTARSSLGMSAHFEYLSVSVDLKKETFVDV